jgi:hypothetical protein
MDTRVGNKILKHRGPLVKCPHFTHKGDMVFASFCKKCKDFKDCPVWEKKAKGGNE